MTQWQYIDTYRDAAQSLGITVYGPVDIVLPNGRVIHAELHFPNFGSLNGTLVVADFEKIRHLVSEALNAGYTYSSFEMLDGEICSADELANMLSEWGWAGAADKKPRWVIELYES